MGNTQTKPSAPDHPETWTPISELESFPRPNFQTKGIKFIGGYLPNPHPAASSNSSPEQECSVLPEDELYRTSWTDWAYVPRITITPSSPRIFAQSPQLDQEWRKLCLRDGLVVRPKTRETQQLSLSSAAILGRREKERFEESVRMTRENTRKRAGWKEGSWSRD